MIGGKVLDSTALRAFAQHRIRAVCEIDALDRQAHTILVPMVAFARALAELPPDEADRLEMLLEFGVVDGDLTRETAPGLAAVITAQPSSPTAMAHTAFCAYERRWPVLTTDQATWAKSFPDVITEEIDET